MVDIAQHIRIFEKLPSDDFVEKRSASIEAIAKLYSSFDTVPDILQLAADLAAGTAKISEFPESRIFEAEEAIKEQSSSFVREGQDLQILTCSLLAALRFLSNAAPSSTKWSHADVLAVGLWSALSYQNPLREARLEALRKELTNVARDLVMRSSQQARTRMNVPNVTVKSPEAYASTTLDTSIKSGTGHTIDALRTNAALDREEIDILWWVLGDWSGTIEKYFSSISPTAAPIYAALDLGTLLRRLPNEAYKHLIMRHIKKDQKISLKKLLGELETDIARVREYYTNNKLIAGREVVFPLISACIAQEPFEVVKDQDLHLSDWASRALLESSIIHISSLTLNLV